MSAVYVECTLPSGGASYSAQSTLENDYGNTQCPLFSIADVQSTEISSIRQAANGQKRPTDSSTTKFVEREPYPARKVVVLVFLEATDRQFA